jgi:hypothetical protein
MPAHPASSRKKTSDKVGRPPSDAPTVGFQINRHELLLVEDQRRVGRAASATFIVDDGSQHFAIGRER